MAIQFVVVQKGNPSNPTAPKKFYAQGRSKGEITLRELAREISEISTVSSIDTMAVLEAMLQLIPRHLSDGQIVRLGEFGSFMVTISSEGAETAEAFNASLIRSNAIRFRPGKEVQKVLKTVQYQRG